MSSRMVNDLIGTTEAAEILGVTSRTVKRLALIGNDLPPAHKMPGDTGAYLFHRADVEALRDRRAERRAERVAAGA